MVPTSIVSEPVESDCPAARPRSPFLILFCKAVYLFFFSASDIKEPPNILSTLFVTESRDLNASGVLILLETLSKLETVSERIAASEIFETDSKEKIVFSANS